MVYSKLSNSQRFMQICIQVSLIRVPILQYIAKTLDILQALTKRIDLADTDIAPASPSLVLKATYIFYQVTNDAVIKIIHMGPGNALGGRKKESYISNRRKSYDTAYYNVCVENSYDT